MVTINNNGTKPPERPFGPINHGSMELTPAAPGERLVELGGVVSSAGIVRLVVEAMLRGDEQLADLWLTWSALCLVQHRHGVWGSVCAEDKEANDRALVHGGRIVSCYEIPASIAERVGGDAPDGRIWIITEADRSITTLLFPREY